MANCCLGIDLIVHEYGGNIKEFDEFWGKHWSHKQFLEMCNCCQSI